MARLFAYERFEYRLFGRKQVIEQGEVAEISEAMASKLSAANPEKLIVLEDGEFPPVIGDSDGVTRTVVMVRPDFNRAMIPGRLSQQKRRQLKNAGKRSRHARLMVSE